MTPHVSHTFRCGNPACQYRDIPFNVLLPVKVMDSISILKSLQCPHCGIAHADSIWDGVNYYASG
jgi:hypothetical protein